MKASERIRQSIASQIRDNGLLPGDPIDEERLMAQFGVSRTPVREALLQLKTEGLVTICCAKLSADEVELSISDDGRGMDESVRRRIFDPFFTTKLGTGGSGLGMHIVHNIVTNVLGGQIEVISSPGQGARMMIRLPTVAPERGGAEASMH